MLKEVKLVSYNVLIMFSILDIGQSTHQKHVRYIQSWKFKLSCSNIPLHLLILTTFNIWKARQLWSGNSYKYYQCNTVCKHKFICIISITKYVPLLHKLQYQLFSKFNLNAKVYTFFYFLIGVVRLYVYVDMFEFNLNASMLNIGE